MKYLALATDFDGTLAYEGVVDDPTIEALVRARSAGLRLLMVTGRELTDLLNTFPRTDLFDQIVVENGAVLYDPVAKNIRTLCEAPPAALVEALTRANIPMSVGHSIIGTVEPHEQTVLAAIRDLGLEWHVIFNKGSVMVLPAGVTKATGLAPALEQLHVPAELTVGIGDAENDHAFLRACGLGVAVANALPSLKQDAQLVTEGARGAGVMELIEKLLSGALDEVVA